MAGDNERQDAQITKEEILKIAEKVGVSVKLMY